MNFNNYYQNKWWFLLGVICIQAIIITGTYTTNLPIQPLIYMFIIGDLIYIKFEQK